MTVDEQYDIECSQLTMYVQATSRALELFTNTHQFQHRQRLLVGFYADVNGEQFKMTSFEENEREESSQLTFLQLASAAAASLPVNQECFRGEKSTTPPNCQPHKKCDKSMSEKVH